MAAIVTTLFIKDSEFALVYSFILYHLSIGFRHVILFFDFSEEYCQSTELIKLRNIFPTRVLFCFRSPSLLSRQAQCCSKYNDLKDFIDCEVPARQTLNAEYALRLLETEEIYKEIRWLLHIDIDEIFYIDESILSVDEHFDYLDSINAKTMTYVNHEGVPEQFDTEDYFATTTLFRRHHFTIGMSPAAEAAMRHWRSRRTHGQYMLVYDNGKSAIRVGSRGAVPMDVHRCVL
jgi:hypothetical protein